ncbi:MAG: GumC domain-containing protein [Planctomycetota bacterium]
MKLKAILFSALFVLVVGAIVATIWTQIVPKYQASGQVRIRPIIPHLVFETEDNGAIGLYESFVNTQVSIIRSDAVLQRVLDQPQVHQTQWFKAPRRSLVHRLIGEPGTAVERLEEALSVEPRSQTEIIDVAVTAPILEEAMIIADAVLEQYVKCTSEMSHSFADELYSKLAEQHRSLKSEIRGQDVISAQIRERIGTANPQELISARRIRLDEAESRLSELRRSIALLEWECKNDKTVAGKDDVEQQPKHHEDAEWREREVTVRTISHYIATSQIEPNDPEMVRARNDLKLADELLKLREAQLQEQWQDRIEKIDAERSVSPKYRLARAKHEEQLMRSAFEKQQAEFRELFEHAQLLERENEALAHKLELFDAVRRRLDRKNMERNVPGRISILSQARASTEPHCNLRILLTYIALILASCIIGIATFLRTHRTRTSGGRINNQLQ